MSEHTEYFVVDEVERVVRAGPFRSADIAEELADRPNDIVATGEALDLVDGEAATSKRPDPPTLDGARCEVAGCGEPATVLCWSDEWETWFRYCSSDADRMIARYDDLEVVEDG